jgi:hypothetical protein
MTIELMKKHYRLLVVDVDGTLLNSRGVISTEDTEAIAAAVESGVPVALSTGRAAMAAGWVLDHLQLGGHHIFFDGALLYNPLTRDEAYAEPIDIRTARQAVALARAADLPFDLYTSSRFYVEKETWAVDIRRQFFRLEPTLASFDEVLRTERIIKGTAVVRTAAERRRLVDLQEQFRGRLVFSWTATPAYPEVDFVNILSPRVSKGKAFDELCILLGVSAREAVAIGDGVNDVSLLKKAGLAVAMGNCAHELKAVAHIVTHDVDHSGVAEAIKNFVL